MLSLSRAVILVLACALTASAALAFDFDEAAWRRDARTVLRMERLSADLRTSVRDFAATRRGDDVVTTDGHEWANRVVDLYARIRGHLEGVRVAWEDAWQTRGVRPDELRDRLRGTALWLAASATFLENAEALVDSFDRTVWAWRLNSPVAGRRELRIAGLFDDMQDALVMPAGRSAVTKRLKFLTEQIRPLNEAILADADGTLEELLRVVAASSELGQDRSRSVFDGLYYRVTTRLARLHSWFSKRVLHRAHQFFNLAEGDPYRDDDPTKEPKFDLGQDVHDEMRSLLRPGDILIEKKKGTLVDRLIPGYWGHVALWVGDEDDLDRAGLFDRTTNRISLHQALTGRPHVQRGRSVLEAVFTGVNLNTLRHFSHCTAAAIIRLKPSAVPAGGDYEATLREVLHRAFVHLGQEYDFWFNVNSHNAIVCSELVYQAFPPFITWPTVNLMNRPTISPDNVAGLAGPTDDFPFEVVFFVADGQVHRGGDAWRPFWKQLKAEGCPVDATEPSHATRLGIVDGLQP